MPENALVLCIRLCARALVPGVMWATFAQRCSAKRRLRGPMAADLGSTVGASRLRRVNSSRGSCRGQTSTASPRV